MDNNFNPYHRWLGIPPAELPADHYRLLGLAQFEDDPDVIRDASERQVAHVRKKALGQYHDLSQKVLNELAEARACLLNVADKKAYDEKLQVRLAPPKAPKTLPIAKPIPAPIPVPPPPFPNAKPAAAKVPFPQLVNKDTPQKGSARKKVSRSQLNQQLPMSSFDLSNKNVKWALAGGGGAIVFVLVALICVYFLLADRGHSKLLKSKSEDKQEIAKADTPTPNTTVEEPTKSKITEKPGIGKTSIPDTVMTSPITLPNRTKTVPPPATNVLPQEAKIESNDTGLLLPRRGAEPSMAIAPFDALQARTHQEEWAKYLDTTVETTNSIGMKIILCPPGSFKMGEGTNVVDVTLTKPYWLGKYEVTQSEWERVMGTTPWKGQLVVREEPNCSASYLSYSMATDFCHRLTASERRMGNLGNEEEYLLPTEAQWEFACRAGSTSRFSFGDNEAHLVDYAWYDRNASLLGEKYAHFVGEKKPNPWGLHDVHGNVWEWCSDWHGAKIAGDVANLAGGVDPSGPTTGSFRVFRGGAWFHDADFCRSAVRNYTHPNAPYYGLGVRLCRSTVRRNENIGLSDQSKTISKPQPNTNSQTATTTTTGNTSVSSQLRIGPEPPLAIAPFDAQQSRTHQEAWAKHLGTTVETTNSIGMKMVLCPPGEFKMGAGLNKVDVTLSHAFWIGKYEATQNEFTNIMGTSPWTGQPNVQEGAAYAASYVSWHDAMEFCKKLTDQERTAGNLPTTEVYRLPTDAEWEYACRAGTTTMFSFGNNQSMNDFGWWGGKFGNGNAKLEQYAHIVGQKKANPFGLHDMHGNVGEWCLDYNQQSNLKRGKDPIGDVSFNVRMCRGGNWSGADGFCHSGNPTTGLIGSRIAFHGFRVVRGRAIANASVSSTPQEVAIAKPPVATAALPNEQQRLDEFLASAKNDEYLKRRAEQEIAQLKNLEHFLGIGQIHVPTGKIPRDVNMQTEIYAGGYFVAAIGSLDKPVNIQMHGCEPLDVNLKNKPRTGRIVDLGHIRLTKLKPSDEAKVRGQLTLFPANEQTKTKVEFYIQGEINTPSNGTGGYALQLPQPHAVHVDSRGQIAASGFSPAQYYVSISAPGYIRRELLIKFNRGETLDMGAIVLEKSKPVRLDYIRSTDTKFDGPIEQAKISSGDYWKPSNDVGWQFFGFPFGQNAGILTIKRATQIADLGVGQVQDFITANSRQTKSRPARTLG